MISLIVYLVCLLIVVVIVRYILDAMALPDPIAKIVWLVFALICLLFLLNAFGYAGAPLFARR